MLVPDGQRELGRIVAKAWSDPIFKDRLKADPKSVLSEMGIEMPEGAEIEVVENTSSKTYLTLPISPSSDVVSDDDIAPLFSLERNGSSKCSIMTLWCPGGPNCGS